MQVKGGNKRRGTGSRNQGAGIREQGAGGRGQGSGIREQEAGARLSGLASEAVWPVGVQGVPGYDRPRALFGEGAGRGAHPSKSLAIQPRQRICHGFDRRADGDSRSGLLHFVGESGARREEAGGPVGQSLEDGHRHALEAGGVDEQIRPNQNFGFRGSRNRFFQGDPRGQLFLPELVLNPLALPPGTRAVEGNVHPIGHGVVLLRPESERVQQKINPLRPDGEPSDETDTDRLIGGCHGVPLIRRIRKVDAVADDETRAAPGPRPGFFERGQEMKGGCAAHEAPESKPIRQRLFPALPGLGLIRQARSRGQDVRNPGPAANSRDLQVGGDVGAVEHDEGKCLACDAAQKTFSVEARVEPPRCLGG